MGRDDQGKTRSHGQLQLPAQAPRRGKLRIQRHQGNGDAGKIDELGQRAEGRGQSKFTAAQARNAAPRFLHYRIPSLPYSLINKKASDRNRRPVLTSETTKREFLQCN